MNSLNGIYTVLLTPFTEQGTILCKIGVMQAEKEIMNQLGFDFGDCLPPFSKVSDEEKHLISKEIIPFIKACNI